MTDATGDTNNKLVQQGFNNTSNQPEVSLVPKDYKIEIKNVTLDETNDDESHIGSVSDASDDGQTKILAEIIMPPFKLNPPKGFKRQDALDISKRTLTRQDAIDNLNYETHSLDYDYNDSIEITPNGKQKGLFTKSESSNKDTMSKIKTIFNRNFSDLYKGKPKSQSMDNLHTSNFKEVLQEFTSIECIGAYNSDSSLFTEGSDSVFTSPYPRTLTFPTHSPVILTKETAEKKIEAEILPNNYIRPLTKNKNLNDAVLTSNFIRNSDMQHNDNNNVPIVTAASILPFPYPDSKSKENSLPNTDVTPEKESPPKILPDLIIEKDFKKANEEIKGSLKAALGRMIGVNKNKKSPPPTVKFTEPVKLQTSETNGDKIVKNIEPLNGVASDEKHTVVNLAEPSNEPIKVRIEEKPSILQEYKSNEQIISERIPNREHHQEISSEKIAEKITYSEPVNKEKVQCDSNNDVDYYLKINKSNEASEPVKIPRRPKIVIENSSNVTTEKPMVSSPTILLSSRYSDQKPIGVLLLASPEILNKPFFYKVMTSESNSFNTNYGKDNSLIANRILKLEEDNTKKKQGIYVKNPKANPLPVPTKSVKAHMNNLPELQPPATSPKKIVPQAKNHEVGKQLKAADWLIDNQYYQPVDNVPFVINTLQTNQKPTLPPPNRNITQNNPFFSNISKMEPPYIDPQENYYEEIGQPIEVPIMKSSNKNIADDEKISHMNKQKSIDYDEWEHIPREALLKVPRKPKKPKRDEMQKPKLIVSTPKIEPDVVKKTTDINNVTKSIISLSRSPSGNETPKRQFGSVGAIVNTYERKPEDELHDRKMGLRPQPKSSEPNTGSLPRPPKKYHWNNLEHKRLSHPIRYLNDPQPTRSLRKCSQKLKPSLM